MPSAVTLELACLKKYFTEASLFNPQTTFAVNDVSLSIKKGQTLGLIGESGCGKSTVARIAVGLLEPTEGQVFLLGKAVHEYTAKERSAIIQMVFQDPYSSLNPRHSIGKAIEEPLIIAGIDRKKRKEQVIHALEQVGLQADYAKRYPHEFSGGQRQRIAIARSVILNPQIIVCDEPVSSLDASVQAQIINLLLELRQQLDLSYLFISHDINVIAHMSDSIAVMYLGRIVEHAPRNKLLNNALHPYTQNLLNTVLQIVPTTKTDSPSYLQSTEIPDSLKEFSGCAFAQHCLRKIPQCLIEVPALREKKEATLHFVRCFNPIGK